MRYRLIHHFLYTHCILFHTLFSFKIVKQVRDYSGKLMHLISISILTKTFRIPVLRSVPSAFRCAHPTLITDKYEILIAFETHFCPRDKQEIAFTSEPWCFQYTAGYNLKIVYIYIYSYD